MYIKALNNQIKLGERHTTSLENYNSLNPKFKIKVLEVLIQLEQRGYYPLIRNGLRTKSQAYRNHKAGVGSKNSLHCYGLAADIVLKDYRTPDLYNKAPKEFWIDLANIAKSLGLRAGFEFTKQDRPHIDVGWRNKHRYNS